MARPWHQPAEAPAPLVCTKEPFAEPEVPRKIQEIKFGIMTPQDVLRCGVLHVHERSLYLMPERTPHPDGVLDRRLGISSKVAACETCGLKLADCAGHFGYVALELPVFHIGYFKATLQVLQCICKTCSHLLLPDSEKRRWARRFRSPRAERVPREAMLRRVAEACKRARVCPHCGAHNGVVKKAGGALKIVHEAYAKASDGPRQLEAMTASAVAYNDAIAPHVARIADDLHPLRARALLEAVPDDVLDVLDIGCRPEDLILTALPVPPVTIRPSVDMDGASNEDDITMKLMQIVEVNSELRQGLARGLPISSLAEHWDFLQVSAAMLINAELPGVASGAGGGAPAARPLRGFVQRLKGKQGRFRGNLSGKRVDFSARTVISPDPNLAVDEVAVPLQMAMTLTYPERVSPHNIARLRAAVLAGHSQWPGANFVEKAAVGGGGGTGGSLGAGPGAPAGGRFALANEKVRRKQAAELRVGDVVERHLRDGDIVLFNRQPSLHRVSIMAFRAAVRPGRTLRFNECACAPFNADFDGDEMNLHAPQTEEARAEAALLMAAGRNLCTPKNGEALVAATQDFLTAAFLLTSKDAVFSRAAVAQLAAYMSDAGEPVDLPAPALLKPAELWTGKQLFGLLLRPNAATRVFVTLEVAEREYSRAGEHMCPKDGYVAFRNSELLCGRLGKAVLGGAKGGLFHTLASDAGPRAAAAAMARLAKLSARALGEIGFSIGVDDVAPAGVLVARKAEIMDDGDRRCAALIEAARRGKLDLIPGCGPEESLEGALTGVLNGLREAAGAACMATLARGNAPLIMSQCGSKGSPINIAQMVACVGQQSVGGKRCFDGFRGRTLPHFARGAKQPAAKGFVRASFYDGLAPAEFFFHTMAGREGLVDTAVKTAETGYMSRRLMKALEDLYAHYDGTTRNAAAAVVQFAYGDDGLDPLLMEGGGGAPLDLARTLAKVRAETAGAGGAGGEVPLPAELARLVDEVLGSDVMLAVAPQEEVLPEYAGPDGEPLAARGGSGGASSSSSGGGGGVSGGRRPQDLYAGAPLEAPAGGAADATCSERFKRDVRRFLRGVAAGYAAKRKALGLPAGARGAPALELAAAAQAGLTRAALAEFVARCREKYRSKRVDPGATVGAVGAQSIGEPGTQMTLKTFHFAGVASMNVTLGVPRIKEIINGSKAISTPIITVRLVNDRDEAAARLVQGRLERTTLGQVARRVAVLLNPKRDGRGAVPMSVAGACVEVVLDMGVLEKLHLAVDNSSVARDIAATPRLKVKMEHIVRVGVDRLYVNPPPDAAAGRSAAGAGALLFELQRLLRALPAVVVAGVPTAARAVVMREGGRSTIAVEGTNLQAAMGVPGVAPYETTTNHVAEVEKFLGIEAARAAIMAEIKFTMGSHGMSIDGRHTMLLADCMTYKGEVLGITRFGIAKMKDSVLHAASFEKTADHLFDAALRGRRDAVVGVSECIIMGAPMPAGTGLFRLAHDAGPQPAPPRRPAPLLYDD